MAERLVQKVPAPALPIPKAGPLKQYLDDLNNILRLFFNLLSNAVNSVFGEQGGRFIEAPNAKFFSTVDQTASIVDTAYALQFENTYLGEAISITGTPSLISYMSLQLSHISPSQDSFRRISPLHFGQTKISKSSFFKVIIIPPVMRFSNLFPEKLSDFIEYHIHSYILHTGDMVALLLKTGTAFDIGHYDPLFCAIGTCP